MHRTMGVILGLMSLRVDNGHFAQYRGPKLWALDVYAEGNEIGAMLLDQTWAQLPPVDVIDARGDRYGVALEELLAYLREDTNLSSNEQTTSFVQPEFLLNNYVLNK